MTPEDEKEIELLKIQREIWAKAVDTQMHFNEMSVKSRQLGLSFVVAALALAFILLSRRQDFSFDFPLINYLIGYQVQIHISGILVWIAAIALYAVRRLDLDVYHMMLRGAVEFGEDFERNVVRDKLMRTQKGMTEFISMYSRNRVKKEEQDGKITYEAKPYKTARNKLMGFYKSTIWLLGIMGAVLIVSSANLTKIPAITLPQKSSVPVEMKGPATPSGPATTIPGQQKGTP